MADEIELKLDLTPQAAAAIEASDLLQPQPATAELRSTYFDTPKHALAKAGLSLRIREAGDQRIQTVKASGASAAGLFARSEWERPVDGLAPVLDHGTPVLAVLGDKADGVAPIFEVHVERRVWVVTADGATIEIALDRGEVVRGGLRAPLCELELELLDGGAEALFTFARRLDAVAPVRLGVLSKSERGYRLDGSQVKAIRAEPVALTTDMTAAQAFQRVVQGCLRQFRLNETVLTDTRDPAALHQARVALRRLRSALAIFKPLLGAGDVASLRQELRWLAGQLGDARNLDVLLERPLPKPVRERLQTGREDAYRQVDEALSSTRSRELMLVLAQWTATGDWLHDPESGPIRDLSAQAFAATALDRLRRRVKKDGRGLAKASDEARHELRKDAKKLRYGAEFFASLYEGKRDSRRRKRFMADLQELQDQLGALNDLATAPLVLAELGLDADAQASALPSGAKKPLIEAAADAHDALKDAKTFWR